MSFTAFPAGVVEEAGPARLPSKSGKRYRTGWISDVHLGARGASASDLLEFLREHEFDKLYVVGDLIDVWQLRRHRHWPQLHNDVIQALLRKARDGTPVIYIPGNHDDFCVNFIGTYGNISIVESDIHITRDNKRLLVMHGHEFDTVTMNARWLAHLGDFGYNFLMKVSWVLNLFRRLFGLGHWSLSAYVKAKVKNAVSAASDFENMVAKYAAMHSAKGIVCGHIHTPAIKTYGEVEYYNTGDWVESCTALVEEDDGNLELIYWRQRSEEIAGDVAWG